MNKTCAISSRKSGVVSADIKGLFHAQSAQILSHINSTSARREAEQRPTPNSDHVSSKWRDDLRVVQISNVDSRTIGRDPSSEGSGAASRAASLDSESVSSATTAVLGFLLSHSCDHFSSIAIGVGSAVTSLVVSVGFGLPDPAKCST